MTDPASVLDKYRDWLYDCDSALVKAWSPDVAHRRFQAAAAELARRTTDDEYSLRYAAACPVPGIDHRAYRLRELTLPGGVSLLAGVHFRGLSTEYPFVGVFAQNRWLSPTEHATAHAALIREFSAFEPRATWWWHPVERDLSTLPGATPDQHLVMGSLEEIRRAPMTPLPPHWELRRIETASDIAPAFAALYRSFHAARPDLAQSVPPTDTESLESCARENGLYACFEGPDIVGVVAAKPDTDYHVHAWLMWDLVLARKYCGQGLAPALQRAVLNRLDARRAPLVVGTIRATNLPSLRTALRVGRRVVGGWCFLSG